MQEYCETRYSLWYSARSVQRRVGRNFESKDIIWTTGVGQRLLIVVTSMHRGRERSHPNFWCMPGTEAPTLGHHQVLHGANPPAHPQAIRRLLGMASNQTDTFWDPPFYRLDLYLPQTAVNLRHQRWFALQRLCNPLQRLCDKNLRLANALNLHDYQTRI